MKDRIVLTVLVMTLILGMMTGCRDGSDDPQVITGEDVMGWDDVSVGAAHVLAVKGNSLWTWGRNFDGQLGTGAWKDKYSPTCLGLITPIVSVSAGMAHSAAITDTGALMVWGMNLYGQLGLGKYLNLGSRNVPARVTPDGYDGWTCVSAGYYHTLALRSDGSMWGFGRNDEGQLGLNYVSDANAGVYNPVQISSGTDWATVIAGGMHSFALKGDGSLWAWGRNDEGQLGDGSNTDRIVPAPIAAGCTWKMISAGDSYTAGIMEDGSLWAWGLNSDGQLGDGTTDNSNVPVRIRTGNNWSLVSAGINHTLAVKTDGTLWAWGSNNLGQLGLVNANDNTIPQQVGKDSDWAKAGAGMFYSIAIRKGGSIWGWGYNGDGQLGTGNTESSSIPVLISE